LCDFFPLAASARMRCGSVKPPTPSAPIFRKERRESPSQYWAVEPRTVSIGRTPSRRFLGGGGVRGGKQGIAFAASGGTRQTENRRQRTEIRSQKSEDRTEHGFVFTPKTLYSLARGQRAIARATPGNLAVGRFAFRGALVVRGSFAWHPGWRTFGADSGRV